MTYSALIRKIKSTLLFLKQKLAEKILKKPIVREFH